MRRSLVVLLVLTAALVFASVSTAGFGRFNDTGKISNHGLTVKVGGPFTLESDEAGATIHVWLVQGGSHAEGNSNYFTGDSWSASVTGNSAFNAGAANARATATVYLVGGGTESYTWTQQITLK